MPVYGKCNGVVHGLNTWILFFNTPTDFCWTIKILQLLFQVQLLYPPTGDGLVLHKDNGIVYSYDVTKCMFSIGNITEKLRLSKFDCRGEVVVDMYAGIGYFTLPYLVHARVDHVHACEWNPDAVTSLERNLELNGVRDRCTIHRGDNREVCPRGVADRVNLGLIPSSEQGWKTACFALKESGGILHIHSNISSYMEGDAGTFTGTNCRQVTSEGEKKHINLYPEFHSNTDERVAVSKNCSSGVNCNTARLSENSQHSTIYWTKGDNSKSVMDNNNAHTWGEISSVEANQIGFITDDSATLFKQKSLAGLGITSNIPKGSENSQHYITDWTGGDNSSKRIKGSSKHSQWLNWAGQTAERISELLTETHSSMWSTEVLHIEHIKSYAPHIDHIVVDLMCKKKCGQKV